MIYNIAKPEVIFFKILLQIIEEINNYNIN